MFLQNTDLDTIIYPEIANLLTRYTPPILMAKLTTAEYELESYLAVRFLIRPELQKTGDSRHPLLKSLCLDIAVYHLYANPEAVPKLRVDRYNQAIKTLEMMARGTIALPDVALVPPDTPGVGGSGAVFYSEPRRPTGW